MPSFAFHADHLNPELRANPLGWVGDDVCQQEVMEVLLWLATVSLRGCYVQVHLSGEGIRIVPECNGTQLPEPVSEEGHKFVFS